MHIGFGVMLHNFPLHSLISLIGFGACMPVIKKILTRTLCLPKKLLKCPGNFWKKFSLNFCEKLIITAYWNCQETEDVYRNMEIDITQEVFSNVRKHLELDEENHVTCIMLIEV